MLTSRQWAYIKHWIILVVIAECIMLVFNKNLTACYLVIAALFLGGFCLRVLNLYPGKPEPLILDLPGIIIALAFAYLAEILKISNLRFLLVFVSSLIILPHIIYIINKTGILR